MPDHISATRQPFANKPVSIAEELLQNFFNTGQSYFDGRFDQASHASWAKSFHIEMSVEFPNFFLYLLSKPVLISDYAKLAHNPQLNWFIWDFFFVNHL